MNETLAVLLTPKWALFTAAFVCFLSAGSSIYWFFKSSHPLKPSMVVLKYLGGITIVTTLTALATRSDEIDAIRFAVSLALYLASLTLFWSSIWANKKKPLRIAFTEGAPPHFVDWGPYKRIRHPFYTSYILAWIAGPVGTNLWWLIIPGVVMTVIYILAARLEERQFADSPFAAEYESLRRRTGMFWPRLG